MHFGSPSQINGQKILLRQSPLPEVRPKHDPKLFKNRFLECYKKYSIKGWFSGKGLVSESLSRADRPFNICIVARLAAMELEIAKALSDYHKLYAVEEQLLDNEQKSINDYLLNSVRTCFDIDIALNLFQGSWPNKKEAAQNVIWAIHSGADVDSVDALGRTILTKAIWGGYEDAALALIPKMSSKVLWSVDGFHKETPLNFARKNGLPRVAALIESLAFS